MGKLFATPFLMVMLLIDTFVFAAMLKTREALFPLMAKMFGSVPVIVRFEVITSSPLVKVIVPLKPDWNIITSSPGELLASIIT